VRRYGDAPGGDPLPMNVAARFVVWCGEWRETFALRRAAREARP
jgi:hypothetical protein